MNPDTQQKYVDVDKSSWFELAKPSHDTDLLQLELKKFDFKLNLNL